MESWALLRSSVAVGVALATAVTMISHRVGGWAAAVGASGRCKRFLPGWGAGKVVLVTGGSNGIGLQTVVELAGAGATVVLACRSVTKGERVKASLSAVVADRIQVMELDLASLRSVVSFAKAFCEAFARLDVLILNAGVARSFLGSSGWRLTEDGLEEMLGVNFLGHFLLTGLLLPTLRKTEGARVVGLSSVALFNSYIRGIDVQSWTKRPHDFTDFSQYGQSKLAIRVFMSELQRREPSLLAVSCHPCVAHTGIVNPGESAGFVELAYGKLLFALLGMHEKTSHLAVVHVATAPANLLEGGACYQPMTKKLARQTDWFQRVAALQLPGRVELEHPALWDAARSILNERTKEAMGQELLPG